MHKDRETTVLSIFTIALVENKVIINMVEITIGGGGCCKKTFGNPVFKCVGSFMGGSDGSDGNGGWNPEGYHGMGTGVSLDQISMQYFHLSPGNGGTQDSGIEYYTEQVSGGGGGGVLVDGVGPDRESTCQGEGYGGGAGALTTQSYKVNNFVGHLGLPGVILVEVY